MKDIISAVLVVGGIGLLFGFILSIASIVFAVKKDERAEKIEEALPGANCGACGFAGCSAYAAAVAAGTAKTNQCVPGKDKVAKKVADIMGVSAEEVSQNVAHVKCKGTCHMTETKFDYVGVSDCIAMSKLAGGNKHCRNACLGLGSCMSVCQFGAISIKDNVAVIDRSLCGGCGACSKICPHNVIEIIPKKSKIVVDCSNTEKAQSANRHCKASCIGCKMCEKVCEAGAIHVINNVAVIDYSKCTACGKCVEKCPKKVIKTV